MTDSPTLAEAPTHAHAAAIILAAGKSTRMRSRLPKPLHSLCGRPLTRHVVAACREAGISRIVVVIGHEAEQVRAGLGDDVEYVIQQEQLGTGHATLCAEQVLADHDGPMLVLAGDVPLLRPETLGRLVAAASASEVFGAMLVAELDDPTGYGRVILDASGSVWRIVEQKDATPEEAAIRTWNPSVYCFRGQGLWKRLREVRSDNAQREYYLTDVVGLAASHGERVVGVPVADATEVLGVNSRVDLAEVAKALRDRVLRKWMLAGVTVVDPASTYVDVDVQLGSDTVLEPQTHLLGKTVIGEECQIGPMTVIRDCRVGNGCVVVASHAENCTIGNAVRIGPYARLRPGCTVGDQTKIGNFVELKNAVIGEGVAASHLSYLGDASVGAYTNIGAGTITCNYDGFAKHRTVIGERAFIGTDNALVAPVSIGNGAMTAAGSTITEDVPDDALAIARAKQVNRDGWAARWREAHAKREKKDG